MNWVDLLPSWSDVASSAIVLAIVTGVGYLVRDSISAWLSTGIQHKFDSKLEVLSNDLDAKSRQIDDLRSGALGVRAQRQGSIDRRRLEAIDQLWEAVKVLRQLRGNCSTMAIVKWPEAAVELAKDPKARDMFEQISSDLPSRFPVDDAHASRPYISQLAWALFNTYRATLFFLRSNVHSSHGRWP